MKKNLLLILIIAATAYQTSSAQKIEMKAGAAFSNWRGDALSSLNSLVDLTGGMVDRKMYTGFYAGASIDIPMASNISIQPGLQYSQTGTSLKGDLNIKGLDFLGINAQANMIQQSIEMPVLLKAKLADGLSLLAGPQASYIFNNTLNVKAGALGFNVLNQNINANNLFEKFNVSAIAGLQYTMPNGFGIAASYEQGLTSIVKDRAAKAYTQSARVGLTYTF